MKRAVALLLVLIPMAAKAQDGGPKYWSIRVSDENDSWFPWGTDDHYTQGIKIEHSRESNAGFGRVLVSGGKPCRRGEYTNEPCFIERVRISIGQNIYTPSDITTSERTVGDRPYAGWLYLEGRIEATTPTSGDSRLGLLGRQWMVGASAGVIGPSSLADTVQRWWHRRPWINAGRPNGWSNQIPDRPAFMLLGEVRQRLLDLRANNHGPRFLDAAAEGGLSVGNVTTNGRIATTTRFGINLPSDFGPAFSIPAAPGFLPTTTPSASPALRPRRKWSAYLFVGVEGRAVLYNAFIDSQHDLYQIARRPWVTDLSGGLGLRFCAVSLTYRSVRRSPEFHPGASVHQFDAFSLAYSHVTCRQ